MSQTDTGSRPPARRRGPAAGTLMIAGLVLAGIGLVVVLALLAWPGGTGSAPSSAKAPAEPAGYPFGACQKCHSNFDQRKTAAVTVFFSHARHYSRAVADCATCHVPNTHGPDKTIRPAMARCYQCHGTTKNARASGRCLTCHPASFIEPSSHLLAGWATGAHRTTAAANRAYCLTCHNYQTFCQACHARGMPPSHLLPGWASGAHDDYAGSYCLTCHAQNFCSNCHARRD